MSRITELFKVIWAAIRCTVGGYGRSAVVLPVWHEGVTCKTYKLYGRVTAAHGLASNVFNDAIVLGRMHFVGLEDSFTEPFLSTFDIYITIDQVYRQDKVLSQHVPPSALSFGPIHVIPHKPRGESGDACHFEGTHTFSHADCMVADVIKPLWSGVEKLRVSAVGNGMYQWLLGYIKLDGNAGLV